MAIVVMAGVKGESDGVFEVYRPRRECMAQTSTDSLLVSFVLSKSTSKTT